MSEDHKTRELQVFTEFLKIRGIPSTPLPQKKDPPKPDIFFDNPLDGPTSYELVEILEQGFAHRLSKQLSFAEILHSAYEQSPHFENLSAVFHNALIHFKFNEQVSKGRVNQLLPDIFKELLHLSKEFEGDVNHFQNSRLSKFIQYIWIRRGGFVGPCFDVANVSWIGEPTAETLQSKFQKTYQTKYPMELVAYILGNPMFPDDVFLAEARDFLQQQVSSHFRRVWILDLQNRRIALEYEVN